MRCRSLLAVAFFATTACGTTTPATEPTSGAKGPPEFVLQLHRPAKIGEEMTQSVVATFDHALRTINGETLLKEQIDKVVITLVARTKVIDVNAVGVATKTELTVESGTVDSGAGPEQLLAAGAVLTITRGGDPAIVANTGTLPQTATQWLRMILPTGPATTTDDEIFGSVEPRAVGAVWSVNTDFVANELGTAGLRMQPGSIIGHATLAAVETMAGQEAQNIRVEVTATGVVPQQTPGDATVEKGELHAELSGWYPTDPSLSRLADAATATVELVLTHPAGSPSVDAGPNEVIRTQITARQHRESTYSAIVPGS